MNLFKTKIIHLTDVSILLYNMKASAVKSPGRNFHAISFRVNGKALLLFEKYGSFESESGSIVFFPQGEIFTPQYDGPSEIISIHFNSEELSGCQPFVLNPLNGKNLRYLFNRLYNVWREDPTPSTIGIMPVVYRIFELIIEESEAQMSYDQSRILFQAVKYMRMKQSDPDLTIRECAEAASVSEDYLRKLFKKNYNQSPVQYLSDLRIAHSKILLSSGYYTVSEIADRSGFSNSSYFCCLFKRYTNLSPSEYSNKQEIN